MLFYVYLARCSDGSLYCGYCTDLQSREEVHNSGKGAKYTRSRLPVRIVYSEEYPDRFAALKREAALKRLSKAEKEQLVERGQN